MEISKHCNPTLHRECYGSVISDWIVTDVQWQGEVFFFNIQKDEKKIIPPYKWIRQMKAELNAGSTKVIGEARESGSVGLFRSSGEVRQGLVEEILTEIPTEKIIWEAPLKAQQVWFVKLLGPNVNLGNISGNEVISLETIRVGLRGDTFNEFL